MNNQGVWEARSRACGTGGWRTVCGQLYNNEMKCIECEKSHIHIEKVIDETHKPKGVATDWPTKIIVTARNGKKALYEYMRGN